MYFHDDPEVDVIVEKCAEKVGRKFGLEASDLAQEGRILIATHPDYADRNLSYGLIYNAMYRDLLNIAQVEAAKRGRTTPLEYEDEEDFDTEYEYIAPAEIPDGPYNRDMVKFLLPAVWDESYAYSLPRKETAPDPDMPRGSTNKARSNNLPVYIADIKTGWEDTPLERSERRAVLMHFGLGYPEREIAAHEGCAPSTIHTRIDGAVGKIVNRLNGGRNYYKNG